MPTRISGPLATQNASALLNPGGPRVGLLQAGRKHWPRRNSKHYQKDKSMHEQLTTEREIQPAADAVATCRMPRLVPGGEPLRELDVAIDEQSAVVFCRFRFTDRPCFTPELLGELRRVRGLLAEQAQQDPTRVRYLVLGSAIPGIFNLGGDLKLFTDLIRRGDRDALGRYARACVAEIHANAVSFDLPITTVSLVQGDALGGGFEAALSSNVLIAERSAKFGLPEVMFNLFPGMGAYNFLARRTDPATAERMILSGRIYTAAELHTMGIVDVLAEDGCGEAALAEYVRTNRNRLAALQAVHRTRRIVSPVTLETLHAVTDLWVETALSLRATDLRMMERLIAAQQRRSRHS